MLIYLINTYNNHIDSKIQLIQNIKKFCKDFCKDKGGIIDIDTDVFNIFVNIYFYKSVTYFQINFLTTYDEKKP